MKSLLFAVTALVWTVGCSSIPEIKPYESKEYTVEEVSKNNGFDYDSDPLFQEEPTTPLADDDSSESASPEPDVQLQPEALALKEPKKAAEKVEKIVKPSRKPSSPFKNGFYTFSQNCTMRSKPSDSGAEAGSVQAGKKLWLDQHNGEWLKAYKKAGTVYVSADCVK